MLEKLLKLKNGYLKVQIYGKKSLVKMLLFTKKDVGDQYKMLFVTTYESWERRKKSVIK